MSKFKKNLAQVAKAPKSFKPLSYMWESQVKIPYCRGKNDNNYTMFFF